MSRTDFKIKGAPSVCKVFCGKIKNVLLEHFHVDLFPTKAAPGWMGVKIQIVSWILVQAYFSRHLLHQQYHVLEFHLTPQ